MHYLPKNPPTARSATTKSKKRRREDDIPPLPAETDTLTKEYKRLANHIKCEACKGHCYVMQNGAHHRLDYKEMSYWAKQIVCVLVSTRIMRLILHRPSETQIYTNRRRRSTLTDVPSALVQVLARVQVLNMKYTSITTLRGPHLVVHVLPTITAKETVPTPLLDLLRRYCRFLRLHSATHLISSRQAQVHPALNQHSFHLSFKGTSSTRCCWNLIKHIQRPNFQRCLPPFTTSALWEQRTSLSVMSVT